MSFSNRASSDAVPLLEGFEVEEELKIEINDKVTESAAFWRRISIQSIQEALKPSFLNRNIIQKPLHPTAWLDGVRGVTAFLVYIYHFQYMFHEAYKLGYASNDGNDDYWLLQLPILRLLTNGWVQVGTFYVLSGVSLSLKPLRLARSHAWDKLLDSMFSSVFRRALRLYLPCFVVQTGVLLATFLGLYNHAYKLSQEWPYSGSNEAMHQVFDSNWEQIWHWQRAMWDFANPFVLNLPMYNPHLWTIPVEFRNSIILFATIVGFSKLSPNVRIGLTICLWAYCMCYGVTESETALFIGGMGIAEFVLIQEETVIQLPPAEASPALWSKRTALHRMFWGVTFIIGLHLLSWPLWGADRTPGYRTLFRITPQFVDRNQYIWVFWQRIGAVLSVFALSGSAFLRRPFETRLATYLGRISFPLYIVHGPLNHTLGFWLVELFFKVTGSEIFVGYEAAIVLAFCMHAVVVIWLADLVMRTVDGPSLEFGRWLQSKWEVRS